MREVSLSQIGIELLLLPNAFGRPFVWGSYNIVPPSWSLGVEAVFYLIVPVLAWLSFRAKVSKIYILILGHIAVLSISAPVGAFITCGWPLKEVFCTHPVSDYFGAEFPLFASVPFLVGFVAHDQFTQGRKSYQLLIWWAMY